MTAYERINAILNAQVSDFQAHGRKNHICDEYCEIYKELSEELAAKTLMQFAASAIILEMGVESSAEKAIKCLMEQFLDLHLTGIIIGMRLARSIDMEKSFAEVGDEKT
jgi:hypothetical protein